MNSACVIPIDTPATSGFQTSEVEQGRSLIESFRGLLWMPQIGIGWYPVTAQPYDEAYFEKYLGYDQTPVGDALTKCRLDLVDRYHLGSVVDVGIGGGRFVSEHHDAWGFDVNPVAVAWLKSHGKYLDPRRSKVQAACFWDSLEHIHDPRSILDNVLRYVFVSLPIFKGCDHILSSKHFRTDEHCWYFTRNGFRRFMGRFGFEMIEESTMEQDAGREDILSFAFVRP